MKRVLIATACVFVGAGLQAQTPKTEVKTGSDDTRQSLSTEERNVRAYMELLRTDLRKGKAQIMGDVLHLDAEDSAKFWPIYKDFEVELTKIGDQVVAAIRTYAENYDKLTPAVADQLAGKVLNIEQQRNALKKKYYDRVKNSVGPLNAMRFLQVENQLERLIDLQLSAQLPVEAPQ